MSWKYLSALLQIENQEKNRIESQIKLKCLWNMTKNKSAKIKVLSFLDRVSILIFALVRVRPWSYLPNKICLRIGYVIFTRVLNQRNWTRVSHEVCFVPYTKLRNGLPLQMSHRAVASQEIQRPFWLFETDILKLFPKRPIFSWALLWYSNGFGFCCQKSCWVKVSEIVGKG